MISKMLYNVHTWTGVRPDDLDHWNNHLRGPIALLMKGVLAQARKFRHPTDMLCAWCGMLPLPQQVHMNRLRFAKRMLQRCPAVLWSFMSADASPHSWLATLTASCLWMQKHYDKPKLLPSSADQAEWIQHICMDIQWKGKIKKTGHLALQYHMAQAEHTIWQHNFEAGYRRSGDIHQIIEQCSLCAGTQVFAISVDLCMQRQNADLANHKALRWWRQRVLSGQIVSLGGGPPCETYTVARRNDGLGPRPVRSAQEPRGLPGLKLREWQQIQIGDRLLRFLLEMLLLMALTGYSGFIEHPQFPTWEKDGAAASIWCMTAIRLLKRLQCVSVVSYDQCVCGAQGRKPTTLLLVRLPKARQDFLSLGWSGRCHHAPGTHQALIGKQADGSFQTAKAKIYPEMMNYILGAAMHAFAADMANPAVVTTLPNDFHPYLEQQFMDHTVVQKDYHG